jgi:hypothetical protein
MPLRILPTTVAPETPSEGQTLATGAPAGARIESQPLPPLQPGQHTAEWGAPWLPAPAQDASAQTVQDQPEALHDDQGTIPPSPVGALLTGLVHIDQAALERAVAEFFDQIDHLGEDFTGAGIGSRLTPWLAAAAVTTAAYAFARRQLGPSRLDGTARGDDGRDQEWAWFTDCAVLPPSDKP